MESRPSSLPGVNGEDDLGDLVERSRKGSAEAFARIVRLHQGRVRAYLRVFLRASDIADDMAQETFLTAYRDLGSYRGDAPLATWLLGIARHRALEHLRQEVRRRARESETVQAALVALRAQLIESEAGDPERHDSELRALRICLGDLPSSSAELVNAHYFGAHSSARIARDLGRNEGAVRMALLRIRRALGECVARRLAVGEI